MFSEEFPRSVQEKLGYYVYLLLDPRDAKIFYVGKGIGNRVFAHAQAAIDDPTDSEKLDRIREILSTGRKVQYIIHRHGLTEKEAYEVEAALIDFVGITDLTNEVEGHNSDDRGKMTVSEIIGKYVALPAQIDKPVILVTFNRRYERGMSIDDIYEKVRGDWVIGTRRKNAEYACAVSNGIIRAVFRIDGWSPVETQDLYKTKRWKFHGKIAEDLWDEYVGRSTEHYLKLVHKILSDI